MRGTSRLRCNDYPGDSNLKILRQTFAYSGYWLNNPPGAKTNPGRESGRLSKLQASAPGSLQRPHLRGDQIGRGRGPVGSSDAAAAVSAARAEDFHCRHYYFLDQEQGGRLLPEQRAYLHAWVDGVNSAHFAAGVYCSGIASRNVRSLHRDCRGHPEQSRRETN